MPLYLSKIPGGNSDCNAGGIIYDVIVEPPSVGSTTDEHGHQRPVAFMPYRVNGEENRQLVRFFNVNESRVAVYFLKFPN